jgi:hypothetical protein
MRSEIDEAIGTRMIKFFAARKIKRKLCHPEG